MRSTDLYITICAGSMQAAGEQGVFCEAEQLLQREGSPSHAQLAELLQGSFSLLCDVKDAGGDQYFRLNDEKASPA